MSPSKSEEERRSGQSNKIKGASHSEVQTDQTFEMEASVDAHEDGAIEMTYAMVK
jgi:hypothetical protein